MKNGLFINYEFCTGCHSCEVACKKEHKLPKGQFGMHVLKDGPRQDVNGKWEYTYCPNVTSEGTSHGEVRETAVKAGDRMSKLIKQTVKKIGAAA